MIRKRRKKPWGICALLMFLALSLLAPPLTADEPIGLITDEMWKSASTKPLAPGEIDHLITAELKKMKRKPAGVISDEYFIRRLTLDLTGKLPTSIEIGNFLADPSKDKRSKLIDKLLSSEAFARHWALYWRDVIASRVDDFFARAMIRQFDKWMTEQLHKNRSWADITKEILTADGPVKFRDNENENGAAFLLMSRRGAEAAVERASETSRIFLGVQIQCAQCHDHPTDKWKRQQFHEFAAYFARLRERPIFEERRIVGFQLVSIPFREYRMPGEEKKRRFGGWIDPRFLDGESPGKRLPDDERREALAEQIISKDNPWFAAAFVNRIWGSLMGQSFYQPVDDLGPLKEASFPTVLPRLAGAFRGSDYNMKELFRTILNSDTYQRDMRLGDSKDVHLFFAAAYPTRLRADALYQSIENALGSASIRGRFGGRRPGGFGGIRRFGGLQFSFIQEFAYDPSTKTNEIEGSVSQTLFLMNNPLINQRIKATGKTLLARTLSEYQEDDEALRTIYLRTLARRPTDREMSRCREYIQDAGNRGEAFEDILWVLINSTEIQTRR